MVHFVTVVLALPELTGDKMNYELLMRTLGILNNLNIGKFIEFRDREFMLDYIGKIPHLVHIPRLW